jgi:hypothetical protein
VTGSSKLTVEQTDQLEKLFGQRYTHIQSDASIVSRAERRRRGQRGTLGRTRMVVPRG